MTLENVLSDLTDGSASTTATGLPAGCFSPAPSLNPINQLILSVFGENFFPPYSAQFQPENKGKLTNEKLLQWQFPGGGKLRPIATPIHSSIPDYITPLTGLLGTVLGFFGPIFIIMDVIRAIIDIICSLFNPVPLIATLVDLFLNVLPPALALFPPLAIVLLALNAIKLIIAIIAAMIAYIVPIIEQIVANALKIQEELSAGNIAAIDGITAKICSLLQYLENQISALAPVKFIIELIQYFMNLGAKFFCAKADEGSGEESSPCCTAENCPPVIINPPAGRAKITKDQNRFSLLDLIDLAIGLISIPISLIGELLETIINTVIGGIEDIVNGAFDLINSVLGGITDVINSIIDAVFFAIPEEDRPYVGSLSLPSMNLDLPEVDISIPNTLEGVIDAFLGPITGILQAIGFNPKSILDILDSIVLVKPETEIKFLMTGGNKVVSQANKNGLLSEVGVGHAYTISELETLQRYIIDPATISEGQDVKDPHTIRARLTRESDNKSVMATVLVPPKNIFGQFLVSDNAASILFGSDTYPADRLVLDTDAFALNDTIRFSLIPNEETLLKLNLIGLGCHSDVAAAAKGLIARVNADIDASAATGGSGNDAPGSGASEGFTGFDPLTEKIGKDFPLPPIEELQECLARQAANPAINQTQCFTDILGDYLRQATEFYDAVLCVGASRIQSTLTASKNFALAGGQDSITLSLAVKDAGGNNLLLGLVPTSSAGVEFKTTLGTIGPAIFNDETGEYQATLISESEGMAEVTAAFKVNGKSCMRPANFDGFNVTDKTLQLEFIPQFGKTPRRRQDRQYVQSRGGRRR